MQESQQQQKPKNQEIYNLQVAQQEKIFEDLKCLQNFEDFNLKPVLLKGIFDNWLDSPSIIQKNIIYSIICNRDIFVLASSGSGKIDAMVIGSCQVIDEDIKEIQALILFPVRNLASETFELVKKVGKYMNIKCNLSVGGVQTRENVLQLQQGENQIIIGTPGRVQDMIDRKCLNLSKLKILIMDEVDNMLDMGFCQQIISILKLIPQESQIVLFYYAKRPLIVEITQQFMKQPEYIEEENQNLTLEGIKQYLVQLESLEQKNETIVQILSLLSVYKTIIYCNSKEQISGLQQYLKQNAPQLKIFSVINSDIEEINRLIDDTKQEQINIIITNDFFAKMINLQNLQLVINFEIPKCKQIYLKRIGRRGCYGRKGIAINFVSPEEITFLGDIEKFYLTQIEQLPQDLSDI